MLCAEGHVDSLQYYPNLIGFHCSRAIVSAAFLNLNYVWTLDLITLLRRPKGGVNHDSLIVCLISFSFNRTSRVIVAPRLHNLFVQVRETVKCQINTTILKQFLMSVVCVFFVFFVQVLHRQEHRLGALLQRGRYEWGHQHGQVSGPRGQLGPQPHHLRHGEP